MQKIKLVKIDSKYCNYLRKFDKKVPYNEGKKELRPFVGVLFMINDIEYFAPLSSPKEKHLRLRKQIDIIKIDEGRLGVVNLNNMIPVTKKNYEVLNINETPNDESDKKYYVLLNKQLKFINKNKEQLFINSKRLYLLYSNNKLSKSLEDRCCNFKLLEEKCNMYNKTLIEV